MVEEPIRHANEATQSRAAPSEGQLSPCIAGKVAIAGPAGNLEALVGCPENTSIAPAAAIICHPHPLHGGSMHNKVVHILARSFEQLGLCTVRFNFRGVGSSSGRYDEGKGETEDLLAVIDWAHSRLADGSLWLAGFSFGSYVAMRAASLRETSQLVLVAPPVNLYDFTGLSAQDGSCLVIQGGEDEIVPPRAVQEWVRRLAAPPQLVTVPGATHFFHKRLNDLRTIVVDWLSPRLPVPRSRG